MMGGHRPPKTVPSESSISLYGLAVNGDVDVHVVPTLMLAQPTEGVIERTLHLAGSTVNGLVNGLRLMRDGNGLAPLVGAPRGALPSCSV
jgi:hypothetical protein